MKLSTRLWEMWLYSKPCAMLMGFWFWLTLEDEPVRNHWDEK